MKPFRKPSISRLPSPTRGAYPCASSARARRGRRRPLTGRWNCISATGRSTSPRRNVVALPAVPEPPGSGAVRVLVTIVRTTSTHSAPMPNLARPSRQAVSRSAVRLQPICQDLVQAVAGPDAGRERELVAHVVRCRLRADIRGIVVPRRLLVTDLGAGGERGVAGELAYARERAFELACGQGPRSRGRNLLSGRRTPCARSRCHRCHRCLPPSRRPRAP